MNNLDKSYQALLQDILDNGTKKEDRTGTGTISVFGRQIRHKMSEGFPLITTKKMYFKGIVTELLWFLRGETNIKPLLDNDCHIWDGDAWKNFCNNHTEVFITKEEFIERIKADDEFAKQWGELGKIYGRQWRSWETFEIHERLYKYEDGTSVFSYVKSDPIDQIANLIHDLKTNPNSRRLMVYAWNVAELDQMVLPPCHYGFQVYTRELSFEERWGLAKKYGYIKGDIEMPTEDSMYMGLNEMKTLNSMWNDSVANTNLPTRAISLIWNQRSCDFPLGIPYNIASYAILLEIIGKMVNMVPDELIGNLGDCHIYLNQIEGCKEQITRESYELPNLVISNQVNFDEGIDEFLNSCFITDFKIEDYQSHPAIKFPLSN